MSRFPVLLPHDVATLVLRGLKVQKCNLFLTKLFLHKNIFTTRVRSTREGNIYTWECLPVQHWWGVPRPTSGWEYPIPGLGGG